MASNISNMMLDRFLLAREMAIAGYVSQIITLETTLSYKQLRRVYDSIKTSGVERCRSGRAVRSGSTIIQSNLDKLQASMLMQLYRTIGGEDVLKKTNIDALNQAYRMYCALRYEIPGYEHRSFRQLSITDAWCLADELRSNLAMIEHCPYCDLEFFMSTNARLVSTRQECPFCKRQPHEEEEMNEINP